MYLDKAIQRINNVNWDEYGRRVNGILENECYGYEYLRRLAMFFKETSIKPLPPIFVNIANLMGCDEEINTETLYSDKAKNALANGSWPNHVVNSYLQLAKIADTNNDMAKYLEVYEPLIRLIELGHEFAYREAGLMIYNAGLYPLRNWYDRYIECVPKEIS